MLNYKHLNHNKLFSVYDDNIFPFFVNNVFSIENFKIISNFGLLQRMSRMTKHVSKAGKVDPGERATLPVKISLYTRPNFNLLAKVTLAQG